MPSGSLTVVGTGIGLGVHLTPEARAAIERADEVLYAVADPVAAAWIGRLNASSRSLYDWYQPAADRAGAYGAMVDAILERVRAGRKVCAAFYGHPGVFVRPSHAAIATARGEGFEARMLPAVSAEDCLVADLGVDPADGGWQSYDATDFLVHNRQVDTSSALVLWQIGVVGERGHAETVDRARLAVLVQRLTGDYPAEHEAVVYEASPFPIGEPRIQRVPLARLGEAEITLLSTLYVPPAREPELDRAMAEKLGVSS